MNTHILQREFDELRTSPHLFDAPNFRARKEARDFLQILASLKYPDAPELSENARDFLDELLDYDQNLWDEFRQRLLNKRPAPLAFRAWLLPFSSYTEKSWALPHHGYEDLDFLLDGILLPEPQPRPSLPPAYGMVRYEPTPASVILELTERIHFSPNDIFYDLGSGLGKVTALVHLLTGVQSVGVEYQPEFCIYAEQQAQNLGLQKVRYINVDARSLAYNDASIFFLFNPFGGEIFETVLEKIRVQAQKREIKICSYGAASQPLSELNWLKEEAPLAQEEMSLAIFLSQEA